MITLGDLINDEIEAISTYSKYLKSHRLNNIQQNVILKIMQDEKKHKALLMKLRKFIYS